MGKRSDFPRHANDFYPTPQSAVPPLIPHLRGIRTFAEPCCGDGALVRHLELVGLRCVYQGDVATGQDALATADYGDPDAIITNPPHTRPLMHALIQHFEKVVPTWLLIDLDWAATKQARPFLLSCTDIVIIGRVRWIEGTKNNGKENFAWYRFDHRHLAAPVFRAGDLVLSAAPRTKKGYTMSEKKLELEVVENAVADDLSIPKPGPFNLDKFKSQAAPTIAGVETLQTALPHCSLSQAKDFVRLHPDDDYWSPELCFVNVPVKGQKIDTLHLIVEGLALQFLPSARVQRFRLALAAKPNDVFFLCHVPTCNLDNAWNASNLQACEQARRFWTQATSRKGEGVEAYKIDSARDADAFPLPKWPTQSLTDLIAVTFAGRMIDTADHPGLLRLIGARQAVS